MIRASSNQLQASILLLSWKRPKNVATILDCQKNFDCVGELLVLNNNPDIQFEYADPKVKYLNCSQNFGLRMRWILAALAQYEFLIFQDDDLMLCEEAIEQFIQHVAADPERAYGLHGRNPDVTGRYDAKSCTGEVEVILTRAAAVHRSVVPLIFAYEAAFREKGFQLPPLNGEDIFLSYCLSAHFGKRHQVLNLPARELEAPHALNARSGHLAERTEIVRLCKRFFNPAP